MKPQAIFFDLDDTLYDLMEPLEKAMRRLLPRHWPQLEKKMQPFFVAVRKHSDLLWEDYIAGRMPLQTLQGERYRRAALELDMPLTEELSHQLQIYYEEEQKQLQLSPGAIPLLQELNKRGIWTGIITNGLTEAQTKKMRTLQIERWVEPTHIYISGTVGIAKPDVALFHYVRQHSGLNDYEITYVGDSWYNDVVPAVKAGWRAVWLNKRQQQPTKETSAYIQLTSLDQLLEQCTGNLP